MSLPASQRVALGDARLLAWGRFVRKRTDSGLGYPKVSPSFRDAVKGSGQGSAALVPDEVFETDSLVSRLRSDRPVVFRAVYWWYVKGLPLSVCAARMRCSPRSVQRYLLVARLFVGGRGNVLPDVEEKGSVNGLS